jgi:hypothetical protein
MYSRQATVAYDYENISILSVESISDPVSVPVNMTAFQIYTDTVLAPVPELLNLSANGSTSFANACTGFDVAYGIGYLLRLYERAYNSYSDGGITLLRGLIAVPFQFSTAMQQTAGSETFPKENHVTASLSKRSYRALIQPWTICVFGLLALLIAIWGIACLAWISFFGPNTPNTSFFPEIDITSKSGTHSVRSFGNGQQFETANETLEDLGKLTRAHGLGNGISRSVVDAIQGKRVYCGSGPRSQGGENVIVLVTEQGQVRLLNKHERYS